MANRRFTQFFYTTHAMPTLIDCNFLVGATGAVTAGTLKGPGVASVTRMGVGIYRVKLQDNYFKFYFASAHFRAPVTGAAVTAGSFVTGTTYQIVTVGTTNYTAVGLPAGLTAAPGQVFTATGAGTGTGTVQALGSSGVFAVESLGDTNLMLNPSAAQQNIGGYVTLKCIDAAGAAVDPANGATMFIEMYLSNSSVVTQGE